jgi:hypothetical protein
VACFVDRHFPMELKNNPFFRIGDMEKALRDTFVRMDELLMTPEGKRELALYKNDISTGATNHSPGETPHSLSQYQAEMLAGRIIL